MYFLNPYGPTMGIDGFGWDESRRLAESAALRRGRAWSMEHGAWPGVH